MDSLEDINKLHKKSAKKIEFWRKIYQATESITTQINAVNSLIGEENLENTDEESDSEDIIPISKNIPALEYIFKDSDFAPVVTEEKQSKEEKELFRYKAVCKEKVITEGFTRALNHRNAMIRFAYRKHYATMKQYKDKGPITVEIWTLDNVTGKVSYLYKFK